MGANMYTTVQVKEIPQVLIVAGDANIQSTLFNIFKGKNYVSHLVKTAGDALEKAKKVPFQLAIIDFNLPDMPGDQLLEELRKINSRTNCLLFTSLPGMKPGGGTKPFLLKVLIDILNRKEAEAK